MKYIPMAILLLLLAFLYYVNVTPKPPMPRSMEGQSVPPIQLPLLGDKENKPQHLLFEGHYTLLNIFGSWCASCVQEQPALLMLAKHPALTIIGIAWRDTPEALRRYLSLYGNPYTSIALDPAGEAVIALGVTGAPESFLISPSGVIIYHHIGPLTADAVHEQLLTRITP